MSMYTNGEYRGNNEQTGALLWQGSVLRKQQVICAWCQQLCNDSGQWHHREGEQHELALTDYSHGICPACVKQFFGDVGSRRG